MCNNVVALGNATADGSVIFGKNSDREPNEAHDLLLVPRARHPKESVVHCTYVEIPQVEETYAVLLAKPSWIWGAEMGANEHGLVIGNTAVFTKVPYETGPGLIGMDFLRLALERTTTPRAAIDLITQLLEEHGQGGNSGFDHKLYYHNTFLLANANEAWVLETAGRQWVAQKVQDVRATSNILSIEREWDLASADLIDYAIEQGWCKNPKTFNFKRCYGGPGLYASYLFTLFSKGEARLRRLTDLLNRDKGDITVQTAMNFLRDHGPNAGADYSPGPGLLQNTVCMHAGYGPVRGDQSVGAMVSHITSDGVTHWFTGASAPCTGIFKPMWLDAGLSNIGPVPTGRYNHTSLWWRHESLHRAVLRDYAIRTALYRGERDSMEERFIAEAQQHLRQPSQERFEFSRQCFVEADQATERWAEQVRATPIQNKQPLLYRYGWKKFNQEASFIDGDAQGTSSIP